MAAICALLAAIAVAAAAGVTDAETPDRILGSRTVCGVRDPVAVAAAATAGRDRMTAVEPDREVLSADGAPPTDRDGASAVDAEATDAEAARRVRLVAA